MKNLTRSDLDRALARSAARGCAFTLRAFQKNLRVKRPQAKACLALLVSEGRARLIVDYTFQRIR